MSDSDKLGRYWLLERIALGGMAEIHLAFVRGPAGFDRVVVLKVLRRDLVSDPDHVRMFLTEARTIARLNHPNIVHAHELEEAGGTWFIAMEHVAGSSFRELLVKVRKRGELIPPDVALGLMIQACAGAQAAHELLSPSGEPMGLVHRDISPDNLMVRGDGHVKLLDFGIAKFARADETTRQGTLKGKIAYMSPEQCRQGELDRRSDVFSLGVVGWELLAAARLFRRESDFASMQAIVGGEVHDLAGERPSMPPELVEVIHRALSLLPDDRQPSAEALRKELQSVADSQGWDVSVDRVGAFVTGHLGDDQSARARDLEAAITQALDGPDDLELSLSEETELLDVAEPAPPASPRRPRTGLMGGLLGAAIGAAATLWWLAEHPTPPPLADEPAAVDAIDGVDEVEPAEPAEDVAPPALAGHAVRVGLAPVMDPGPYLAAHEGVRLHLEGSLQRPVELVPHDSYLDLAASLLDGSVDVASLPPKLYLETRAAAEIDVLAFKQVDGGTGTDSVLIVAEDDTAADIAALSGSVICLTDPSSTTGFALPSSALSAAGLDGDDYTTRLSGNHLQALRDVLDGTCRAAGTYSDMLRAADATELEVGSLRVLALTGRSPQDGICSGPHTDEALSEQLTDALLSYEPPADSEPTVENITGFGDGTDAAYDDLRRALHAAP
ncbi:MAG: PhnD/SsuA/transferrin family substrate-binding protein [Proteobacteria bacterium]|nr:PhnD/SsuA/transferrin family substrate-binding protein [Pseudomonadota bacterium]MCP4915590.1 PhnD/SsuA/transferrin family substrate-binding protein [Pseudomonadota bacterium]